MNHTGGWMNGWMGGSMWAWSPIGILVAILLVVVIIIPTAKTVSQAATALQRAVKANEFGVLHIHNLKDTLTPTKLIEMFNAPELNDVAQEVEGSIVKIMNETAIS